MSDGIKYTMIMEQTARITIRETENGEPVLVTTGSVVKLGGSINLSYDSEDGSFIIGISDGIVTITRQGEQEYTLMLCEGRDYAFSISTPYGDIPMRVRPLSVAFDDNRDGLSVRLSYDLIGGDMKERFGLFLDCVYM